MPLDVRDRRIAVGVGKVLTFVAVTQVLLQLVVFTALRAVSAAYWSQYDGRGLNEPWFLSSSIAILGVGGEPWTQEFTWASVERIVFDTIRKPTAAAGCGKMAPPRQNSSPTAAMTLSTDGR